MAAATTTSMFSFTIDLTTSDNSVLQFFATSEITTAIAIQTVYKSIPSTPGWEVISKCRIRTEDISSPFPHAFILIPGSAHDYYWHCIYPGGPMCAPCAKIMYALTSYREWSVPDSGSPHTI